MSFRNRDWPRGYGARFVVPLAGVLLTLVAVATAVVLAPAPRAEADAEQARPAGAAPTPAPAAKKYLSAASAATKRSEAWWDKRQRWYRERLHDDSQYPLATLWGVVHLFGATNALAIADPTPTRRAAVKQFARGAERYWNPNLRPVPGYAAYPGNRGAHARTWFDDNGWWGIAFYDAYRATGNRRYLESAKRALNFIDKSGWDRRRGGLWWDTRHTHLAGETLAGGTLTAALLYRSTREPKYLAIAKKYISWADADFRGDDGLYDRHERDTTPMPYVQGPMFEAFAVLCASTGDHSWCDDAEELADRSAARFPKLTMGPQYDAMYVRSLLELYRLDGNSRWYYIAAQTADRAMVSARASNGLYLLTWDGGPMSTVDTKSRLLQTHAATTSLIAWMSAADPP